MRPAEVETGQEWLNQHGGKKCKPNGYSIQNNDDDLDLVYCIVQSLKTITTLIKHWSVPYLPTKYCTQLSTHLEHIMRWNPQCWMPHPQGPYPQPSLAHRPEVLPISHRSLLTEQWRIQGVVAFATPALNLLIKISTQPLGTTTDWPHPMLHSKQSRHECLWCNPLFRSPLRRSYSFTECFKVLTVYLQGCPKCVLTTPEMRTSL